MIRYLLSKLFPVRMRSTYALSVQGQLVREGLDRTNHFRDDDHHDLVESRWWQWRGRTFRHRTLSTCIG